MTDRPLFDRPSRDPILVTWLALLGLIAALALNANTTWSGHVESDRVAGFLGDFLAGAFLSLLLLLGPAYIRWFWRYSSTLQLPRRSWWRPGFWAGVSNAFIGDLRGASAAGHGGNVSGAGGHHHAGSLRPRHESDRALGAAGRPGVWPLNGGRLFASGRRGGPSGPLRPSRNERRARVSAPRFTSISVASDVAAPGVPTRITWHAEDARFVTINGIHGFPPSGSSQVQVHTSGPVELSAEGPGGTTTDRTPEVLYLALPEISKVAMPPGPGVTFETALQLRPDDDWVLGRQMSAILRSNHRATRRLTVDAQSRPQPLVPDTVTHRLVRNLLPSDRMVSSLTEILSPRLQPGVANPHDEGRQSA